MPKDAENRHDLFAFMFCLQLPVPAPETPDTEKRPEWEVQNTGRQWIRRLVIGAVILALLIGCFFWYQSGQKKNNMELHTMQNEDTTSLEVPEFNLNLG